MRLQQAQYIGPGRIAKRIRVRMVSVINVELKPDVFHLHSYQSTFSASFHEEKQNYKTPQHKAWCSFHPVNLKRMTKVKIKPSNSTNRRLEETSTKASSVQFAPDKSHQPKLFQTTFLNSKNKAAIESYFRSEMDLSKTELPDKDIKILNLLVKK